MRRRMVCVKILLVWLLFHPGVTAKYHPLINEDQRIRDHIINLTQELYGLWQCFEIHRQYQVVIYNPVPTLELEVVAATACKAGATVTLLQDFLHLPFIMSNMGTRGTDFHITLTPADFLQVKYASVWQRWTGLPLTNELGRHVVLLSSPLDISNKLFQRVVRSFAAQLGSPRLAFVPVYARAGALHFRREDDGRLRMAVLPLAAFCASSGHNLFQAALPARPVFIRPFQMAASFQGGQWEDRHGELHADAPNEHLQRLLHARVAAAEPRANRSREPLPNALRPSTYSVMQWYSPLVGYSAPVAQDDVCVVVRKAGAVPFTLVLLLPFTAATWAMVALAMVALALAWGALLAVHSGGRAAGDLAVAYFLEAVLTGSISGRVWWLSLRILALSSIFMYVVVGSAYQGLLLSFLTTPKYFSDINTLSEVAQAVDVLYTALHPHSFLSSPNGERTLAVERAPIESHQDELRALQEIAQTGRKAITTTVSSFSHFSKMRQFTASGRPLLHRVRDPFFSPGMQVFTFRKKNVMSKYVSDVLQRVVQAGLYAHWCEAKQHLIILDSSAANNKSEEDSKVDVDKPLTLAQFTGTFSLLATGVLGALVCFLMEMFYQMWST